MSKQLIYLISFVLVVSMADNASADLVAHWRFDETSGSIAHDTSGNGHDGTIDGTPNWVPGQVGGAMRFDGSSYVVIDDAIGTFESFSVALWFKYDSFIADWNSIWHNNGWTSGYLHHMVTNYAGEDVRVQFALNGVSDQFGITPIETDVWYHSTVTYDSAAGQMNFYLTTEDEKAINLDAALTVSGPAINITAGQIGGWEGGRLSNATFDDIRMYDHVLSEIEILGVMAGEAWPYAYSPIPEDGALLTNFPGGVLGTSLSWKPGGYAVSHDVYFGTDYAEVEAGTGDTFRGNQTGTYFLAGYGYTPNDPAPTGFVPGMTYYWRIDEVNDTEPNSPWKGDVWSFEVADTTAYSPNPLDGAKFVDTDADLSWKTGLGAIEQTVYFSDDYDTVSTAITGGTNVGGIATTYDPGPLEFGTAYYWRVDTIGVFGPVTGDVWSFRTVPDIPITDPNLIGWWQLDEGSGDVALDLSGHGNHGTLYGDPQRIIGYDGDGLDLDGSNDYVGTGKSLLSNMSQFTVTGWVSAGNPETGRIGLFGQNDAVEFGFQGGDIHIYTAGGGEARTAWTAPNLTWRHIAAVGNGTNLKVYVDGVLVVSGGTVTDSYGSSSFGFNIGGGGVWDAGGNWLEGQIDDVRVYDKELTQEEVKQTMRGDPLLAWDPSPTNGSTPDIDQVVPLSWSPGDEASQHDVYFGTDEDAVEFADISDTTGIYRIRQSGTNYTPGEGVEWGTGPYYWRIDEYNTDGAISKGRVWSFTVADFMSIDNIEGYDAEDQIWYNWVDGLGFVKPDEPPNPGNGSGSEVGDGTTTSFTEETIVHSGAQSMPFNYNNNDPLKLKYSEAKLTLSAARDWTKEGVKALSLWFQGRPASVGSFTDNFNGTYTMTGSGTDIEGSSDEFHFAYKTLTGAGTIIARIDSVGNTNDWAKAGVMIRETLDPNSAQAFACVTPNSGVAAQSRNSTGGGYLNVNQGGGGVITAPHWVKLERSMAGDFTVTHSTDGSSWVPVEGATVQTIPMTTNVYVGLALTSHDAALTCEATFSNVAITGNVTGQWTSQDIGILSNDAEPLYVAIANNTGQPAVVVHDDPNAAQIDEWTEWNIDLRDFAGINLADVNSIAVGVGNRNNPQAGGAGKMYFDDFALYRPRCVPDELTLSEADLNSDCVVGFRDLEIMVGDWLANDLDVAADLNSDSTVDFKDYAVLVDDWLDEQVWPDL